MDNSLDTHGRFGSQIRQNPIYTTTIQKPVTVLESTLSPPLTIHSSTVTTDRPVWSQTSQTDNSFNPYGRFGSKIHHGRYLQSYGRRGGFAAGGSRGGYVVRGPRGGFIAGGYRRGGVVAGGRRGNRWGNRYLEENQ